MQITRIFDLIEKIIDSIPGILGVYSIEKEAGINNWKEIYDKGKEYQEKDLEEIKSEIKTDDLATIIYTSGTTGNPKGVMLSHINFIHNFQDASNILSVNPLSRALSFLPLCHVYERMINYM